MLLWQPAVSVSCFSDSVIEYAAIPTGGWHNMGEIGKEGNISTKNGFLSHQKQKMCTIRPEQQYSLLKESLFEKESYDFQHDFKKETYTLGLPALRFIIYRSQQQTCDITATPESFSASEIPLFPKGSLVFFCWVGQKVVWVHISIGTTALAFCSGRYQHCGAWKSWSGQNQVCQAEQTGKEN